MTKLYKSRKDLPEKFAWEEKLFTDSAIRKDCVGYLYLLALVEIAAESPYSNLRELYNIGMENNAFIIGSNVAYPSFNCIYSSIVYATKDIPKEKKHASIKKLVYQSAIALVSLRSSGRIS